MNESVASASHRPDTLKSLTDVEIGGIKFPDMKIGDTVTKAEDWLSGKLREIESKLPPAAPAAPPKIPLVRATVASWRREQERAKSAAPPKMPSPQPSRPQLRFQKGPK